jgi:uncharacterized protein YdeI (YjbR/CyaY-like superfamily)
MAKKLDTLELFHPANRQEWRAWLAENYDKKDGVWMVSYKRETGKSRVTYDEAVEEALCFGWIDSVPNKIDDERSKQLFSPRNLKSNWSKLNKERVAILIANGLMTQAGMEKIEYAQQNGQWTALDTVEALEIPDDLTAAFSLFPSAEVHFSAFPKSVKRGILEWILNAKTSETRQKRITETATLAEQNIRANQFVKKS